MSLQTVTNETFFTKDTKNKNIKNYTWEGRRELKGAQKNKNKTAINNYAKTANFRNSIRNNSIVTVTVGSKFFFVWNNFVCASSVKGRSSVQRV